MWRKYHRLAEMRLGLSQIIALFGYLRLFEFMLDRSIARYTARERFSLLNTAAEEPRGIQIVLEQIILRLIVMRVARDRFLESLVRLLRISHRQESTVFGAAAPRPPQPEVVFRTVRSELDAFFEELCRLLVLRHHEVVLTCEQVSGDIRRRVLAQDL